VQILDLLGILDLVNELQIVDFHSANPKFINKSEIRNSLHSNSNSLMRVSRVL
jgi:hypothetical protein